MKLDVFILQKINGDRKGKRRICFIWLVIFIAVLILSIIRNYGYEIMSMSVIFIILLLVTIIFNSGEFKVTDFERKLYLNDYRNYLVDKEQEQKALEEIREFNK